MPMFGYDNDVSGWNYGLMTVGMLIFWGLLIAGVILLWRRTDRRGTTPPRSPEERLSQRFADGDIDGTEYAQRLETLREHARS